MHRFWDIESYDNLFCVGFLDDNDHLDMFHICDQPEDVERACKDSGLDYTIYDLRENCESLRTFMENPIPSDGQATLLSDFLGTDNKVVEPKKDWYFAYNSMNYDIPMIDHVLKSAIANRVRTSAEALRKYSNVVINATSNVMDVNPYLRYGNHVDVAFLNETKIKNGRPIVGLKTLIGIMGGSIIESESNKTGHSEDIYGDVLYNINDITGLKYTVFPGKMETVFKVRKTLIDNYPKLTQYGVTVNSTSAKFVEYIVSPDEPIEDTPVVTYMYPAKHVADRLGVKQTDILEDTKAWYLKNVYSPIMKVNPKAANEHLAKFQSIYNYYDSFRGENWNSSTSHVFKHERPYKDKIERIRMNRTYGTILPFIDRKGNESPSYVQFSIGGIHGAEINQKQLDQDRKKVAELKEKYGQISKIPAKAVNRNLRNIIQLQSRTTYKGYPRRCSHEIPYFYENTEMIDDIIEPDQFSPYQIQKGKSYEGICDFQEKLHDRYTYTSSGAAVHQDFIGYYPLLLINLGAFYDGKGVDRYKEVYDLRVALKATLKTLDKDSEKYTLTDIEQEGYKLILNSASGILDGNHDTNLRANNKAIAMRVIGQLFTFRIGMALALEGAIIPSSNTDGIYALNIHIDKNKEIVDRELKSLYIDIDPEDMFLVSKDSNNRMEIVDGNVTSARGGTLTSWKGARVDNSLSHPALVDRIMTDYLQEADLMKPVDLDIIRKHLDNYIANTDMRRFVYMSSWVLRSTSGSIFVDSDSNVHKGTIRVWLSNKGVKLTRYNTRSNSTKKGGTLKTYAAQLFPSSKLGKPEVIEYLSRLGVLENTFEDAITVQEYLDLDANAKDDVKFSVPIVSETKIANLADTAHLYVNNESINEMSEEQIKAIYNNIEKEEYVALIADFAEVWHNKLLAS